MSTNGFPPRTPKDGGAKSTVPSLSTLQSDSSLVHEDSPIISPDSSDAVYEDNDSDSFHSSDQENRVDTSNVSSDYMPTRPTTKKRGNFKYNQSSSNMSMDSDLPASTVGGPNLLMMANTRHADGYETEPPSVHRAPTDPDSPSFHASSPNDLPTGYPSDLHAICAKVNASGEKLRAKLLVAQGSPDVRTVDENGRVPLHLLGSNEFLISYFLKQAKPANCAKFNGLPHTELDDFVLDLVKAFPRGCITTDNEGRVPFTKTLCDWVTLASKGILPVSGDMDNVNTLNDIMAAEQGNDGPSRSQRVEGMERVVEDASASRHQQQQRRNDDETLGSRSVWTNLTNLTIPSAFKSVYSTSMASDHGLTTRALYRNQNNASMSSLEGADHPEEHIATRHKSSRSHVKVEDDPADMASPSSRPTMFFTRDDRSLGSFSSAPDGASFDDVFPDEIPVPPVVEWNLKMLSAIVEHFESGAEDVSDEDEDGTVLGTWQAQQRSRERQGTPGADTHVFHGAHNDSELIAKTLVSAVSSVPSLMKTLLLLEDTDPAKQRLFNLTIVKRMIYNPHTIGNWLVYMLEAIDSDVADRGVQFLEMLSSNPETSDFYGGTTVKGFPNKGVPTEEQRLRLYKKVSRLDYLLPAVLALEDPKMVDRVAKTHLMRHIQDRELVQRPTLLMAFFDLLFHVLTLVAFTMATNYFLEGQEYGNRYLAQVLVTIACLIFRIAWKLAQMASMIKISRGAFVSNNFRAGDLLIDWLTIGMVIGGLVWIEITIPDKGEGGDVVDSKYMRGYLAVTIGMLYASLLRWFYIINWAVTTFIDMLRQVMRDSLAFFFVLTITVLSFASMFYVILYDKDGECSEGGFCDKKDVYLEVYSIVLGQFDLEDFSTTFSVVLFVIFTVFVAMVLFYALIAVVIEAHAKFTTARFSTARPEHGSRARLVYVAQLRAFRRMIEGEWSLMQYVSAVLFLASTGLIMVLFLREIRDHFDDFYGDIILGVIGAALIIFLLFAILAFVSHMTYYDLTETSSPAQRLWNKIVGCFVCRAFAWPIHAIMLVILGVPGEKKSSQVDRNSTPMPKKMDPQDIVERWGGSAAHMHSDVKRMIESSQDQTKMVFMEELTAMEGRMRQLSDRTKAHLLMEVSASQQRLEKMISEVQSVLMQVVYDPADDDGQKQQKEDASVSSKRSRQGPVEQTPSGWKRSDRPPTGRNRPAETTGNDSSVAPSMVQHDWSVDGVEGYQY